MWGSFIFRYIPWFWCFSVTWHNEFLGQNQDQGLISKASVVAIHFVQIHVRIRKQTDVVYAVLCLSWSVFDKYTQTLVIHVGSSCQRCCSQLAEWTTSGLPWLKIPSLRHTGRNDTNITIVTVGAKVVAQIVTVPAKQDCDDLFVVQKNIPGPSHIEAELSI